MTHAHVETTAQAYELAYRLIGSDKTVELDQDATQGSGYQIRRFEGGWISDLRTRLEINFHSGDTLNVWIDDQRVVTPSDLISMIAKLSPAEKGKLDAKDQALIDLLSERLTLHLENNAH